jgi:hypothetical protein
MQLLSTARRLVSSAAALALVSGLAQAQFTLSEAFVNPPGNDNGQEGFEVRGAPNASLAGYFLLVVEGDGASAGTLDVVLNLGAFSTGSNGLFLWRDAASAINPAADPATSINIADFNPDIENGSNTFILGFGTPPAQGTDLDSDNDATLNAGALVGFTVVDAISILENDNTPADNDGYADDLGFTNFGPFAGFTPDAFQRTYNASGVLCNTIVGDLLGTNPGGPYTWDTGAGRTFGFEAHSVSASGGLDLGSLNSAAALDNDLDGVLNACDGCPADAAKTSPGACGCGVSDVDSDNDGTADCNDGCPADPLKTAPGACGCGVADLDGDADGVADCVDNCTTVANPSQADCDLDLVGDACEIAAGTSNDKNLNTVPDECELGLVVNYCTAGTSTNGCTPTLSASGVPSAAALSGFTVSCAGLEGQKQGLIFYSATGKKASVWAPGSTSFLCLKAPTQRTGAQGSGGTTNACDGALSLDFSAWVATHPAGQGVPFASGDQVWFQTWYRDPSAPATTNLSDGLQVTFAP